MKPWEIDLFLALLFTVPHKWVTLFQKSRVPPEMNLPVKELAHGSKTTWVSLWPEAGNHGWSQLQTTNNPKVILPHFWDTLYTLHSGDRFHFLWQTNIRISLHFQHTGPLSQWSRAGDSKHPLNVRFLRASETQDEIRRWSEEKQSTEDKGWRSPIKSVMTAVALMNWREN